MKGFVTRFQNAVTAANNVYVLLPDKLGFDFCVSPLVTSHTRGVSRHPKRRHQRK